MNDLERHLDRYAGPGLDGHLFIGPCGGEHHQSNFRDDWIEARTTAGVSEDAHFHDLRHTGNTLAS
ncbi:hypothetical protein ACFVXH_23640 [Kitasatospora sp. NPDC058184]|uniref:hypothetical protein n=1 Tax=Kitasatospora sp. NPDC058184 TaxID=3346370 RepID=UPI0036DA0F8A